jgi:arylsulfatase A-like enzyme
LPETNARVPVRWRRLARLALLFAAVACAGETTEPPPNLLLFVLDTTRADHLGCYGHARQTSPTLDALAARGVRFDNALAQSSLTPVSAGSVLTGASPFRHGVRSLFVVGRHRLADDVTSLAEVLGRHGLATAAFVSARPMGAQYGLDRGFDEYADDLGRHGRRNKQRGLANPYQRRADETAQLALDWLARHGDAPFFLMIHFFDPHDPTLVPPRAFLDERVSFALPADLDRMGNLAGKGGAPDIRRAAPAQRVELYDAEIAYMDQQVRRILDRLDRQGLLDDSIVGVIGDHGEGLGQHDFWTHGLLYQEQLRVPLILRGPGIPSGRVVRGRVRLVDLAPSLAELYALGPWPGLSDGSSFVSLMRGGEEERERAVYAEVHHDAEDFLGRDAQMYALTLDPWKYIHRPTRGRHELYDLAGDPAELENVYRDDHPMALLLRSRLHSLGAITGYTAPREEMSPEQLEALRSLGYLGE